MAPSIALHQQAQAAAAAGWQDESGEVGSDELEGGVWAAHGEAWQLPSGNSQLDEGLHEAAAHQLSSLAAAVDALSAVLEQQQQQQQQDPVQLQVPGSRRPTGIMRGRQEAAAPAAGRTSAASMAVAASPRVRFHREGAGGEQWGEQPGLASKAPAGRQPAARGGAAEGQGPAIDALEQAEQAALDALGAAADVYQEIAAAAAAQRGPAAGGAPSDGGCCCCNHSSKGCCCCNRNSCSGNPLEQQPRRPPPAAEQQPRCSSQPASRAAAMAGSSNPAGSSRAGAAVGNSAVLKARGNMGIAAAQSASAGTPTAGGGGAGGGWWGSSALPPAPALQPSMKSPSPAAGWARKSMVNLYPGAAGMAAVAAGSSPSGGSAFGAASAYHIPSVMKRIVESEEGRSIAHKLIHNKPDMTNHQVGRH